MLGLLRLCPTGPGGVDVLYKDFYHGFARRGGEYPSASDYRLAHKVDQPLHIWKNIYRLGELFCPSNVPVISKSIFEKLPLADCTAESVVFDRPYFLKYEINIPSFVFFHLKDYRKGQALLFSQAGDPDLRIGLEYNAIFPPKAWGLIREKLSLNDSELQAIFESFTNGPKVLKTIGTSFIERVGIIDARNMLDGWLLSSAVRRILQNTIDPHFFEIVDV